MNVKKMFSRLSIFVVLLSVFLVVGCEKNSTNVISEEQSNQEIEAVENAINFYPPIDDDYFYAQIEGKIIVPNDITVSDKVKNILLERLEDKTILEFIEDRGYIKYSKKNIESMDRYGQSKKEAENFFKKAGFDLEKVLNRDLESSYKSPYNQYDFTYVPHYTQRDNVENPYSYYWCGHANLKCVAKKHGQSKTLGQIHNAFWNNSVHYRNNSYCYPSFCSSMSDLLWCANDQNNQSWNYDFPNSTTEEMPNNDIVHFYQRLRDGVTYNKPVIIASESLYGDIGHFFTVTGYYINYVNGSIDYGNSYVYVRDVYQLNPTWDFADNYIKINKFYDDQIGNSILFVRPN